MIDFNKIQKPLAHFSQYEVKPLIHDLINEGTLTLVYAASGGGKSLFVMEMAKAVATGTPFLGYNVEKLSTCFVDGEMSGTSINKRATAFEMLDIPLTDLSYISSAEAGEDALDFSNASVKKRFYKYIEASGYRFIVLDNLRTLLNIESENDSTQFTAFNTFITSLRNLGCTVVVVHHANKDASNLTYSGSSNIITVYDYAIGLGSSSVEDSRTMLITKNRDGSGLDLLNGKTITFKDNSHTLDYYSEINLESICEDLLKEIEQGRISTISTICMWFSEHSVAIAGKDRTITYIYENYIEPYSTHHQATTLKGFRGMLAKAKLIKPDSIPF